MPRVAKDRVAPHELHGIAKVDNNLSMRERIKKRFRPSDTVQVRNVTNKEISWQWMDEEEETYGIEDDTNIKITEREDPGLWRLDGGETDVLPGACAYLFIEALYKMVCVMKIGIVLHPLDEREVRNFSFDDPERQEQFIDAVFIGKLTPTMMQQAAVSKLPNQDREIIEHLPELATEKTEYKRRHASESRLVNRTEVVEPHREISDLAGDFEFEDESPLLGRATGGLPEDRRVPATGDDDSEGSDGEPEGDEAPDPAPTPVATTPKPKPAAKPKTAKKPEPQPTN